MPSICLIFYVHHPLLLKHYTFFDIDHDHNYADVEKNLQILNKVSDNCYLPANSILLDLINQYGGDFRVSFSITGICLDQFEKYRVDVLDSFKRLADTGCVEFINETYHHSLASLFSTREFREQVMLHKKKVKALFGQTPKAFRNTEFIYNGDLAKIIEKMGFHVILAEGSDKILGGRSPHYVYQPEGCKKMKLLLSDFRLSHTVSLYTSDAKRTEYPLLGDKHSRWIHNKSDTGDTINLFLDYEIFDVHRFEKTNLFEFLPTFPREIVKHPEYRFQTPSEIAGDCDPIAQLDVTDFVSSAKDEQDLSTWVGNNLQKDAATTLYRMESRVRLCKDDMFLHTWRMLQACDHFYYMRTEGLADEDVQAQSNPYGSPYDAYINYMNIVDDFSRYSGKNRGANL